MKTCCGHLTRNKAGFEAIQHQLTQAMLLRESAACWMSCRRSTCCPQPIEQTCSELYSSSFLQWKAQRALNHIRKVILIADTARYSMTVVVVSHSRVAKSVPFFFPILTVGPILVYRLVYLYAAAQHCWHACTLTVSCSAVTVGPPDAQ